MSTRKRYNPCECRELVESVRVPKNYPGEYRKMVESVRVPGIGRISESTEKLSGRVPEKVESLCGPENGRTVRAPGIGRIDESTEKLSGEYRKR